MGETTRSYIVPRYTGYMYFLEALLSANINVQVSKHVTPFSAER
jgi:hypothetical protein